MRHRWFDNPHFQQFIHDPDWPIITGIAHFFLLLSIFIVLLRPMHLLFGDVFLTLMGVLALLTLIRLLIQLFLPKQSNVPASSKRANDTPSLSEQQEQ